MASDINNVNLVGRLTRDPELRTLPSGTTVCQIGLASNESFKNANDEWQEHANFFDVTVWGRQGEACAKYLSTGRQVAVQGSLRYRSWENKDGEKRSKVEIKADRVQFLSDGQANNNRADDDIPYNEPVVASAADDDVPF